MLLNYYKLLQAYANKAAIIICKKITYMRTYLMKLKKKTLTCAKNKRVTNESNNFAFNNAISKFI